MYQENLIPLEDDAAWREALRHLPHALAHTPEYLKALSLSLHRGGGEERKKMWLYVFEGSESRRVCPLLEREWNGYADVVTPYGFNGFCGGGDDPEFQVHWVNFAAARGWVCGYIGLNPVLPIPEESDQSSEKFDTGNHVYLVDLTRSEAQLTESLSSNVKKRLREWRRSGARIIDDQERARRFFIDNYHDFTRRIGATEVYHFSQATLSELAKIERVFLLGAEDEAGRLEAVSVFGHSDYCGEYLFNVSQPEGRRHSAALLWEGMLRLKFCGVPAVNLGGGVKAGDGLDQFKARFGGLRRPLRALKQIYHRDAFISCCNQAGVDPLATADYFPPYRGRKRI